VEIMGIFSETYGGLLATIAVSRLIEKIKVVWGRFICETMVNCMKYGGRFICETMVNCMKYGELYEIWWSFHLRNYWCAGGTRMKDLGARVRGATLTEEYYLTIVIDSSIL